MVDAIDESVKAGIVSMLDLYSLDGDPIGLGYSPESNFYRLRSPVQDAQKVEVSFPKQPLYDLVAPTLALIPAIQTMDMVAMSVPGELEGYVRLESGVLIDGTLADTLEISGDEFDIDEECIRPMVGLKDLALFSPR